MSAMPTSTTAVAIVPARMGSTRFPGKVLADSTGWPLIRHVYAAASGASCVARVVVATDDERVAVAVRGFGGEAVLTGDHHANGTSRLVEAAARLGLPAETVIVNVQGDEPELEPDLIDAAVLALGEGKAPMATAAVPFGADADPSNPNLVKVVLALDGTAMLFTRARIPYVRDPAIDGASTRPLLHVGLYAYRRSFLERYAAMPPTPLERTEQLEQLRVLEHGDRIAVAVREMHTLGGIDTPEQYAAFVARWRARRA